MCDWGRTHIAVERKHTEWRDHRTNLNDCGTKRVYFRFPLTSGAETRPPLPAGPHHCTKHLNHTSMGKESHADDKTCRAISNRPRSAAPVFAFHGFCNCVQSLHLGAFRSPMQSKFREWASFRCVVIAAAKAPAAPIAPRRQRVVES